MCRIDLFTCCNSLLAASDQQQLTVIGRAKLTHPRRMFSNVFNFSFSHAPRIYVFESTFPVWLRPALRCLPALGSIDAVSMMLKLIIDGFAVGSTFTGTPLPFS